jgi:hypothetical protein
MTLMTNHARPSSENVMITNQILSALDMPRRFIKEGNLSPSDRTANTKGKYRIIRRHPAY